MKNCCVCGKDIVNEEPAILFVGLDFENKEICTDCEQKLDIMTNSNRPAEIKDAINYFYNYSLSTTDKEVTQFLKEGIHANALLVGEPEEDKTRKTIDTIGNRDYFCDKKAKLNKNSTATWIFVLTIIAWVACISMIVGGIIFAFQIGGETGITVFIGMLLSACLSLTIIMVFANMARDVSNIKKDISDVKRKLQEKNKK